MSKIMRDRIRRKYHRSIICNSSEVESTQMPINRRMNKCMCCIQPMMQNNENKRTVYMNNKWTEFQKLNVELKEFKKYILYTDSIHMWPECVCKLCLSRIRQINGYLWQCSKQKEVWWSFWGGGKITHPNVCCMGYVLCGNASSNTYNL